MARAGLVAALGRRGPAAAAGGCAALLRGHEPVDELLLLPAHGEAESLLGEARRRKLENVVVSGEIGERRRGLEGKTGPRVTCSRCLSWGTVSPRSSAARRLEASTVLPA